MCALATLHILVGVALVVASHRLTKQNGAGWRWASYLATLAIPMPLIGVLITAIALVHAFDAVAFADASERAALLAREISEAMNGLACSLVVSWAIYAAVGVSLLVGRARGKAGA